MITIKVLNATILTEQLVDFKECSARRSFNLPHDDRHKMLRLGNGDIQACDQCCDDKDYCNVQLCDYPIRK